MNAVAPRMHDLVIVGGGLVGASLALALEPLGLDIALVDAAAAGELPPVFDERSLSFAEATINALTALGVMQALEAHGGPIRRIVVTRAGDFGQARLDATRYGRTEFGQVVVARDFGQALEARLERMSRLTRYRPARLMSTSMDGALRSVVLDQGGETITLAAPLVVGADGTASALRTSLGIEADSHEYGHALFVARLRTGRAPDGTAYERLTDHGPTALLPRADRHFGLVHGVADDEADAVQALDEDAFLARLQSRLGWRHGRLLACGERSRYAGRRVIARRVIAPCAVLVGNAAQTIHPLGAQGFNLGLRDALTLAEEIAVALGEGGQAAIGHGSVLQRYVDRRSEDRRRTLAFSDGLLRVGIAPGTLLRPLRSLALLSLDHPSWLQAWLVGGAMGYRGDVPALCRADDGRRSA
ncbi:2-octaprenyl-6-methoxyphenyl hydroxylase [Cognatilysobacter lacus]|uniref:2-octaprenyl-6-methoxyphenyl hydroxylase n=1 Tax=Cognatilysobacter lacus TaxID=1643323 RepID=A0A5D8YWL9_9GAMM|nr:2-octaprenyl-6-methoxyphenyl hydroxylase [Lysobacter lacus]TZF87135.1 2-octaprenyl-6-methoxyphenyl hydroxylase [Lysobacter lacus]